MKRRLLTGILPVIFLGMATGAPTLIAQSTSTFSATGSMATGRYGHTATLLRDGRVLIAGGFTEASGLYGGIPAGFEGRGITASAELYDPVTGQFVASGNMTAARAYHTATLLQDGRVLIASGRGTDHSDDNLASAELYDPSTGTFTAAGNMTSHSFNDVNTATLLSDGRVLITGVSRSELYDPASGMFAVTGNMTMPPTFATATLLPDASYSPTFTVPQSMIPLAAALQLQAVRPKARRVRQSCSRTAKCWLQEVTMTQALWITQTFTTPRREHSPSPGTWQHPGQTSQ